MPAPQNLAGQGKAHPQVTPGALKLGGGKAADIVVAISGAAHCIACQWPRMARSSSSGVTPVSTSPAPLIADQVPPSALNPW